MARRPAAWLGWVLVVMVAGLQAIPFMEGYRRSADDVAFLDAASQGWSAVAVMTEALTVSQGRIGLLFTIPLNALGAYLSDLLAARVVFVLLHVCVFAAFAVYFSLVSASKVTRVLLLLLVTLQPLCRVDEFMPPVTYPLQNSLPYLCLLLARCIVVRESRRGDGGRPARLWPAYAVFTLAMLTTEYAFLLGTSLLLAEHGFALAGGDRQRAVRTARRDALSVGLVLAAYFGFRIVFPSTYEGNVLDGAFDIPRVLATTLRHVWAGTTFSHPLIPPPPSPWGVWVVAAVVGIATAWGLLLSLLAVRSLPWPVAVVAGCLLVMAYVSFPLAANARQQRWCLEQGACGYLDSRLSYLAVGVLLLAGLAWGLRRLGRPAFERAFVVSVSLVLGAVGALTFMDSWQRGRTMHADARAWRTAALLACYPAYQPSSDDDLLKTIDPDRRVPFHPGSDRAAFWRRHMRQAYGPTDCHLTGDVAASRLAQVKWLGPVIAPGQTVSFAARAGGGAYLGRGWSQPEPHGVWSDGPEAELRLLLRDVPDDRQAYLGIRFVPYLGPSVPQQEVEASINGKPAAEWRLTADRDHSGCCERFIALPRGLAPNQTITVVFRLSRPRVPALEPGSRETRQLGIYLMAITLTDVRPSP